MSATNWKLENGLCRCCLSEGLFKDLGGSFVLNGQLKIYSDTLKDCLDIDLKPMDGEFSMITYTICESCIAKLQDVYNFKNQVLISEERFQEMYSTQIINECEVNVKVEINEDLKDENHTYLDDDDFNYPESDEDNKKLAEIKTSNDALKKGKGKGKTKASPQTKRKATTKNTRSKKKAVDEKAKIDSKEEVDVEIDTELEALDDVDGEEAEGEEPKKKKGKGNTGLPDIGEHYSLENRESGSKFHCKLCGHRLNSRDAIERHILVVHLNVSFEKCPLCPSKFRHKNDLNAHLTVFHGKKASHGSDKVKTEGVDYVCPYCSNVYKTKIALRQHVRNIHKLKKCHICDGMFVEKDMSKHMLEVHEDRIPTCGICGYKNKKECRIIAHQRKIHMKEKNVKCTLCDKTFFETSYLTRHMIKHGSEKLYECRFCKKKFPRLSALRMHEKIHTGEKNKVCPVCNERFVQKASLNYHMAKYHSLMELNKIKFCTV